MQAASHAFGLRHLGTDGAGGYAGRGRSATGGGDRAFDHNSPWPRAPAKAAKARGDAAAMANAAKAARIRLASGVAAQRESAQSARALKMRADKMNVGPSARAPGSIGKEPGNRYAPPGSTGHASTQGSSS